uniref:SEC14-like protein 2 n=2 Tax=Plectus sambesii TaxID=2011161 RepID=A0A914WA98_9BILA
MRAYPSHANVGWPQPPPPPPSDQRHLGRAGLRRFRGWRRVALGAKLPRSGGESGTQIVAGRPAGLVANQIADGGGVDDARSRPAPHRQSMTAVGPITDEERASLDALRFVVHGLDSFNDGFLLRWLRGKDHKFDETAEGVRKHLIFRKAWNLDNLSEWDAPEILEKYCGYGFLADKDGSPILMSLLGNMDVEGMLKSVQAQDYIKFSLAAIERGVELCEERAGKTNAPFEQMMLVFDLDNITSAHYSCKTFAASFVTLLMLFQENYPLVLNKILVIRAPAMARYAFNMLTPFLSDSIQQMIDIPSDEQWQHELGKYVQLEGWPMHWGGQLTDPNGDPKCPSKVRYGLGPVPETYFVDRSSALSDYDDKTTVYAGDKHLIELNVEPNTRISWQYMTADDDIGFAIHYDKTGKANNLTEMEAVFPYIRLECSLVPVSGSLLCEKPGRYLIEFDNYYSWFSAKELRYNIDIHEPLQSN